MIQEMMIKREIQLIKNHKKQEDETKNSKI